VTVAITQRKNAGAGPPCRTSIGVGLDVDGSVAVVGALDATTLKQDGVALPFTSATGAIDATGRVTTTDGVASGTARVVGGKAAGITAAGTAHTGSTDEAVLASYSIPASTIKAGTIVKVRFQGICSTTTGATTLTYRLRMGPTTLTGTAIITSGAVDAADNDIFTGYAEIVGRAAPGATAAVVAVTQFSQVAAAGGAVIAGFMGSTNFATNGILLLELTADWSAADANSCRADIFNVEVVG
jgi:hypothetical protein